MSLLSAEEIAAIKAVVQNTSREEKAHGGATRQHARAVMEYFLTFPDMLAAAEANGYDLKAAEEFAAPRGRGRRSSPVGYRSLREKVKSADSKLERMGYTDPKFRDDVLAEYFGLQPKQVQGHRYGGLPT
jgi:hypothetical protein